MAIYDIPGLFFNYHFLPHNFFVNVGGKSYSVLRFFELILPNLHDHHQLDLVPILVTLVQLVVSLHGRHDEVGSNPW